MAVSGGCLSCYPCAHDRILEFPPHCMVEYSSKTQPDARKPDPLVGRPPSLLCVLRRSGDDCVDWLLIVTEKRL